MAINHLLHGVILQATFFSWYAQTYVFLHVARDQTSNFRWWKPHDETAFQAANDLALPAWKADELAASIVTRIRSMEFSPTLRIHGTNNGIFTFKS